MAERIRKLTNSEVEVLARIIADNMTGSQMNYWMKWSLLFIQEPS